MHHSHVPRVVEAWRGDLKAKNRPKIAAAIASPDEQADLFEEGWEEALRREEQGGDEPAADEQDSPVHVEAPAINGDAHAGAQH